MKRRWGKRDRGSRDETLSTEDPYELSFEVSSEQVLDLSKAGVSRIDIAFDDEGESAAAANSEHSVDILLEEADVWPYADPVAERDVARGNETLDWWVADESVDDSEPELPGSAPTEPDEPDEPKVRRSWRFELLALFGMVMIWSLVAVILKIMPPVYKSSWTIMIPGTTFGSSINLDNLATANTSVGSQYGSKAIDPKVNYKSIALSPVVLDEAALRLDMDPDDFGLPKVSLVDQTTMLMMTTSADSAELAHQKSQALYDAFHDQLDELRLGERAIKQSENEDQLASYRKAVDDALAALQDFRSGAEIVSADQYRMLATRIGDVGEKRRDAEIRLASLRARYEAIQRSLGMSPSEAGRVLRLRQDVMLQSQLAAYAKVHAEMVELEAVLGARHPKVLHARSKSALAYQALLVRAGDVVGTTSSNMLKQLMPNGLTDNVVLYQDLIRLEADKLGIESEMAGLDASLPTLRAQILRYSSDASKLEELERNHQIARTILVSATSRIDLANSDIYASYPMTQEFVVPTVPKKPGRLRKLFVILGGLMGSGLIFLALIVYWNRDRWRRLIQKSA